MKKIKQVNGASCTTFIILTSLLIFLPYTTAVADTTVAKNIEHLISSGPFSARVMELLVLFGVLSIAPSLVVMTTSYIRISIVLSVLRTALGLQQSPPNQVLTSLALFLTFFIMSPNIETAYNNGIRPMLNDEMDIGDAMPHITQPFKQFMLDNAQQKDIDLFSGIAKISIQNPEDLPFRVVIPAFIISELKRGFEIAFLIFLPFLIIDIVVSSVLMAMGMMMMPPATIALPFKIIFFVIIDGWYLLAGSLVKSFGLG
ncbi:Flagellar biosynthetic protein FliP [Rickettsiales endosymbiont of Paramecium tredecaurelia]|uniref:flagellar type III secretion system pore protein FliP n=1 Tax=Candidatus Sarmatiella mevalonica TaxID=2770581 RepID=UPI001FC7CFC1|nr:flagellar type III secretion system pore protein FliP [Candidatus Sarmatiella mevalonica]MBL3284190.1 Flagellar biosynthetic protein FliP [Candidatus Sarmatiella mevalonica]